MFSLDSRVNRTLSQINEEYDEDDLSALLSKPHTPNTNRRGKSIDSVSPRSPRSMQRNLNLSMTNKSDIQVAPRVVIDVENMEADFNHFLDKLYN